MKNSRGFTLLEVIIVVALIGIMAAVAIPSINSWLPNYRLKGAARDLYSAAMIAKSEAAKRKINCAISFNLPAGGYTVYADVDSDSLFDAGEEILFQASTLPTGVSFNGLTFTANSGGYPTIAYRPNGVPTDSGGGFANGTASLINANGKTRSVVINIAGNVRIN